MEQANEQPHKRRVRYSGTHPRKFSEKYKELNPEKYQDMAAHIIEKGGTPAGTHISICVGEILAFLQIRPGQQGLDATLGYGGHSREMLRKLSGNGHLYALDVDPIESEKTKERLQKQGFGPEQLTVFLRNFAELSEIVSEVGKFDFILADLGVSSMQIDDPERGFSYKAEGPLDLRMNPYQGESAAERLREIDREELCGMLIENADEPYAEEIAKAIVKRQKKHPQLETTQELREIIEAALSGIPGMTDAERKEAVRKSCQRVFQALRIDVNHEYESLYAFLQALPGALKPGGRVAILSFHSGEDRLVKKLFKEGKRAGLYSAVAEDVIRPSAEECARNSRAKSTKMRWAIRAEDDTEQKTR